MSEDKPKKKVTRKKAKVSVNKKIDLKGGSLLIADYDAGIEGDLRITYPKSMDKSTLKKKLEFIMRKL